MSKQKISVPENVVESRNCMERCMLWYKQKNQQMLKDTTGEGTLRIMPITALGSNVSDQPQTT